MDYFEICNGDLFRYTGRGRKPYQYIPDEFSTDGEVGFDDEQSAPGPVSIVIPKGVTAIGEWAFSDCPEEMAICAPEGSYGADYKNTQDFLERNGPKGHYEFDIPPVEPFNAWISSDEPFGDLFFGPDDPPLFDSGNSLILKPDSSLIPKPDDPLIPKPDDPLPDSSLFD